jgi:hypothetical protein
MTLPQTTINRINAEAEKYGFVVPYDGSNKFYNDDKVKGYKAGATEWAGKAEEQIEAALHEERNAIQAKMTGMETGYLEQIKGLVDTLKWIQMHCPIEAIVDDAIDAALAKYKEVGNAKS